MDQNPKNAPALLTEIERDIEAACGVLTDEYGYDNAIVRKVAEARYLIEQAQGMIRRAARRGAA